MPENRYDVNSATVREVKLGNLLVNLGNYCVYVEGEYVELSLRQFEILRVMLEHPDEILPYETFIEAVWQVTERPQLRNLSVQVHRLRQKLAGTYPFVVKTMRSRGYSLIRMRSTTDKLTLP